MSGISMGSSKCTIQCTILWIHSSEKVKASGYLRQISSAPTPPHSLHTPPGGNLPPHTECGPHPCSRSSHVGRMAMDGNDAHGKWRRMAPFKSGGLLGPQASALSISVSVEAQKPPDAQPCLSRSPALPDPDLSCALASLVPLRLHASACWSGRRLQPNLTEFEVIRNDYCRCLHEEANCWLLIERQLRVGHCRRFLF